MTRVFRLAAAIAMMTAIHAATASAQDLPKLEVSGGWNFLHSTEDDESVPVGWYGDIAGNVTRTVAIVGQVTGAYKTVDETMTAFGFPVTVTGSGRLHIFMGGVRFSARQRPQVVPFAQVLVGVARVSTTVEGSVTVRGQTTTVEESESENRPSFEAGGGVDVPLTDNVGVRFGASYVRIGASDGDNGVRASAGIVIPF